MTKKKTEAPLKINADFETALKTLLEDKNSKKDKQSNVKEKQKKS